MRIRSRRGFLVSVLKRAKRGNTVESVAAAYLEFAASSPALYEVMFSLSLSVPFDDAATPPEVRFAFSQLLELFKGQSSKSEVISELFWASLHGIAELARTKRFTRSRQKERVRALVELFTLLTIIQIRCFSNVVNSGGGRLGSSELLSGEGFHFVS
jgi:hypothetical protein